MGLAGFIVSIASLFLCGIPAIIGIILSIIGLGKNPKGFAVAGLLIGFIAMLELVALGAVFYGAFTVVETVKKGVENIGTQVQLSAEANEIALEWQDSGELPNEEDGQAAVAGTTDMYGNQIIYETDGTSFTLRSRGLDGELNTDDDITVGPFSDPEEALSFDPEELEMQINQLEQMDGLDVEAGLLEEKLNREMEAMKQKIEDQNQ